MISPPARGYTAQTADVAWGPTSYAMERLVGIKRHRVRAIQAKIENSPFAACWKDELEKAMITAKRLLKR